MSTKQANKQHKYYERNTKPQTTNHRDNGHPYIRGWQNRIREYSANTNIPPKIAGWRFSALCVRGGIDCSRGAQRGAVAAVALLCAAVCCAFLRGAWERAGRTELLGVRRTPRCCQGPADAAHIWCAPARCSAPARPGGQGAAWAAGQPKLSGAAGDRRGRGCARKSRVSGRAVVRVSLGRASPTPNALTHI